MRYSNTFICFLVEKEAIIKYVRNYWKDGGHRNCVQLRTRRGDLTPHVYVRIYAITLSRTLTILATGEILRLFT